MALNIDVSELEVPRLEMGNGAEYSDPRVGLLHAGPFSLRFGSAHKSEVRIGMVGSDDMLRLANNWITRCQEPILTGRDNQRMYLEFPGFTAAFRSTLVTTSSWQLDVSDQLRTAFSKTGIERFESVLAIFSEAVERLTKEFRLDVIMCCLSPEIVTTCGSVTRRLTRNERNRIGHTKRRQDSAQLMLSPQWEIEDTSEDLLERDFRRALKARVMATSVPIQIATSKLFVDNFGDQDPATRAWNFTVALFYKAGGLPWRVRFIGPETCFIGISFHHLRTTHRAIVYSGLAQAFSSEGEGFALRGNATLRPHQHERYPHLEAEQAQALGERVLREYQERTGRQPKRIVLHKTTRFDQGEREGLTKAFRQIPMSEFVNLAPSDFRLVQRSAYPPKRGTLCRVNDTAAYLFTSGFMTEWGTYPGVHVPVPVEIDAGESADTVRLATEVLGLARMNWNTAFDTTGAPITLRFARQIGGIMAEFGTISTEEPQSSYRFYM